MRGISTAGLLTSLVVFFFSLAGRIPSTALLAMKAALLGRIGKPQQAREALIRPLEIEPQHHLALKLRSGMAPEK